MRMNGFTLIELLAYISIFMLIAYVLVSYTVQCTKTWYRQSATIHHDIHVLLAYDVMIRDLRQAPSARHQWKKMEDDAYIWQCTYKNYDIGWCVEDGKLMRITGRYDPNTMKWHTKRTGLTVHNVHGLHLETMYHDSMIQAIRCALKSNGHDSATLSHRVTIRERCL